MTARVPPGHRVSVLNVRSGKADARRHTAPAGLRTAPPFSASASVPSILLPGSSQKSRRHFPFAEIPFAIPGGMPHRCRTWRQCPFVPGRACADEPVLSGHLRISFRPSGLGTRRSARVIRPFRKHQMHGEETACSCYIILNLREYNNTKTNPRVKAVVARTTWILLLFRLPLKEQNSQYDYTSRNSECLCGKHTFIIPSVIAVSVSPGRFCWLPHQPSKSA